ncbi:sensor histidine kinase [Fibrella forsythiae]|uniref:Histidine kinase n=1 Tax=Fibrella forsythiae TaxID=2817061 RepID=A0ABS3JRD9_9BACT|nr:histidine kinase [Fibrella forsythiae]MBO0952578.1 histidine kinase [Fibrella forsythiae]
MDTFSDQKLRIYGPFVLFLIGTLFFRLNWYFELSLSDLAISDLISLVAGYVCWELARWMIHQLQARYPNLLNTRRRLRWMVLLLFTLANVAWAMRRLGYVLLATDDRFMVPLPNYTYGLGIQLFYHCVYYVVYEGGYVLQAWRQTYNNNEQLKKNRLTHQLNQLRTQLNPHFLFNSLNSLSMLIHENPRQAEAFVDELSSVYRYVLRSNNHNEEAPELTTLEQELQFIRSYFELLTIRYGKGIDLHIDVDCRYLNHQIPPLTLQLLVENAVKHNVILSDSPLRVVIFTEGLQLVIQNNLQRKNSAVHSTKIGLNSIAMKYRLLGSFAISICEEAGYFVVKLPLLPTQLTPVNEP